MFSFANIQLEIELLDDNAPAGFWGARLRGGYGTLLKRGLCDHPDYKDCRDCPRFLRCDYPALFKPARAPEQWLERPLGGDRLPAPFVLDAPVVTPPDVRRGRRLRFGLGLMGARMIAQFAYPIRAFEAFGHEGVIGKHERRARFRLVNVYDALNEQQSIYQKGILTPPRQIHVSALTQAATGVGEALELRFVTRTCIEQKNAPRLDPRNGQAIFSTFYDVMLNVINRVGGLQQLYGEGWPGQRAFLQQREQLLRQAKAVEKIQDTLAMEYETHYASRREQREPFDGFRGTVRFRGELTPFAQWLRLGELVHVGQQTSYGLGQFQMRPV